MSDAGVQACLVQMESWLQGSGAAPAAEELVAWNRRFGLEVATAERGPAWQHILQRAHALGTAVEGLSTALIAHRDSLKAELAAQAQGNRALKGYGASAR
jgi:hypothetical protein